MSFIKEMFRSIPENWFIMLNVLLTGGLAVLSYCLAKYVKSCFDESGGNKLKEKNYYLLEKLYAGFITCISIFPLLGMLGTVIALINIGPLLSSAESIDGLKGDFFLALTSTAWGILWAIAFKGVNVFIQPFIENQIKKAKETLGI